MFIFAEQYQIMKNNRTHILLALGLIFIGATSRIVNVEMSLYNLAPVGAIGLFAGAVIKDKRVAYLVPLLSLFIADLYIQMFSNIMKGFYGFEQLFVYGGMALVAMLGSAMKNIEHAKPAKYALNTVGFSIAGSAIFFIVSNFGSFLTGMWGSGFEGLVTTYTMALPFFEKSMTSDLVGSALLFGSYLAVGRSIFAVQAQKA